MWLSRFESFLASRSERFYFLALFLVAVAVFMPGLGDKGFDSLQELRVAQVAHEMVHNGDYIRPHYLGAYRFQKPPLAYWICAASYKLTGRIDEWSARLPFALISVACAGLFFVFMSGAFSARAAFIGTLALITGNKFIKYARSCQIDNLLIFCLLVSAFLFYKGRKDKKHWLYLFAWAAAGVGFLAKGLAALLFAAVVLPLVFVFSRDRDGFKKFVLWSLPGFIVFGAIASSWYIAMLVFDPEAWAIMRRELAVLVDSSRHSNYFFYYCYQLFGALFPGFAFFVPAVWLWRKKLKESQAAALLFVWFGVFFVVLSAMTSKQPHYCLLMSVPVACGAGWFIDRLVAGSPVPRWAMRWTDTAFYLCTLAVVIGVPVANIGFSLGYWNYEPVNWGVVVLLSVVSGLAAFMYFSKSLLPAFVLLFFSSVIIFVPLHAGLKFRDVPDTSLKTFCSKVEKIVPPEKRIFHSYPLSVYVAFYLNGEPGVFSSADELRKLLKERGSLYVIYNSMEPMPDYGFVRREELLREKFSHMDKFYYLERLSLRRDS